MKELYCLKFKGETTNLKSFKFDESFVFNKTGVEKFVVSIDGVKYRMESELPITTEADKIITVMGYVEAGKKGNQHSNTKADRIRLVGCIDSRFPIHGKLEKGQKIVGYIKVQDMDCYVAITVKKSLTPIFASIAVAGIIICLVALNLYNPVKTQQPADISAFKTGEKGTGEFKDKETSPMETVYFNINLNATPTIQNGSMNLRLVNKEIVNNEQNNLSCVVKVSLLSTADKDGNQVEKIDELQVYESPLIHPSENIENCVLDVPVEPGRYIGRAMYYIYDSNLYLVGKTAAKLDIVAK